MPIPDQAYSALSRNITEFLQQHLYDRINYPTTGIAGNQAVFFSTPIGSSATLIGTTGSTPTTVVKTARDTNMAIPNFVADRVYSFSGMNMKIIRYTTATTDVVDQQIIVNNGWLEFQVGDKYLLTTPLLDVPVLNSIIQTVVTGGNAIDNGRAMVFSFADPIVVSPGQTLRVYLKYPGLCAITTSVDVMLTLYSTMLRSV